MEAEFLTLMRAELDKAMAQLELRLVDRFASKKDYEADQKAVAEKLDNHEGRLGVLETAQAGAVVMSTLKWRVVQLAFGGLTAAIVGALIYVLH